MGDAGIIAYPGAGPGAGHGATPAADAAAVGVNPEEMQRALQQRGGAAAVGANPGAAPGIAGYEGGRGGGIGGDFKEDDPEFVISRFADAVLADDFETAGKYVATKATGLLGAVRKGDISDNQKQQIKAYVTGLKHIGTRSSGRSKTANFNSDSNKVLSFKIEKISDEFLLSGMDVHDPPRKRAGR